MKPVFLTGGTGLVGSHVADLLAGMGHEVRALVRPGSDAGLLSRWGCTPVGGTLEDDPERFARWIEGCEAVVHAAAVTYTGFAWEKVHAVNVGGTRNVMAGAALAGVERAVHLSSVAVYGDPRGSVDETTPIDTPLTARERYARSKREAERAAAEVLRPTGIPLMILRPSAVYGERDRLFTPKLARLARLPIHPLPGGGRTPLPAVYAGNLAHAIAGALQHPAPFPVRAFNVSGDHPLTLREFIEALTEASGRSFRPLPIPAGWVRFSARAAHSLQIRLPGGGELPVRRAAHLSLTPNPFSSNRARSELGWTPPVPLGEALVRTAEWAVQAGLL